jgi:TolA-binding protein
MNAKTALSCLLGVLMLTLTACTSADLMRERDRETMDLRRQVEQLRLQVQAKEGEARKLAGQLAEAQKLQTQVAALEDRLRVMDDMMMSKSEDIARLEAQMAAEREAAAAKAASAKKGKPAMKAPAASPKAKGEPSMPVDVPAKAPEAPATGAKP